MTQDTQSDNATEQETVYVTGSRAVAFHRTTDCRVLDQTENAKPVARDADHILQGRQPCKVCFDYAVDQSHHDAAPQRALRDASADDIGVGEEGSA